MCHCRIRSYNHKLNIKGIDPIIAWINESLICWYITKIHPIKDVINAIQKKSIWILKIFDKYNDR